MGNITLAITPSLGNDLTEQHNITLNYTHYQGIRETETKTDSIKREAQDLKNKIITNLKENIEDQS